jgi:ribulose bisphosphate carboxylase small subunit
MKLEFWGGTSFESNDAQDIMKIIARQRKHLDMKYVRVEALRRRTYSKLAKIEQYLTKAQSNS